MMPRFLETMGEVSENLQQLSRTDPGEFGESPEAEVLIEKIEGGVRSLDRLNFDSVVRALTFLTRMHDDVRELMKTIS